MHSTLVIRKMQINIITAHCYLRLRTGQMTMTTHTIADKDMEELKLHTSLMINPFWQTGDGFLTLHLLYNPTILLLDIYPKEKETRIR